MTGNITLSYKGKTGKNTVIGDVEYDIDEITDSDFSKTAARVFDDINSGEIGVLLLPNFFIA